MGGALRTFLYRVRGLFAKERSDREFAEELAFHLQMRIEDNLRAGMNPSEARRAALIESGGLESAKEAWRDRRGLPIVATLVQDLRYALRTLLRDPGFTMTALLILSVGIGANTAIFSAIYAVLLRPLPYPDPGRLIMVWTDDPKHGIHQEGVSYPNFEDWRKMNRSFDGMAYFSRGVTATITSGQEPEPVEPCVVSANLFRVLDVRPEIGRDFSEDEIRSGGRVIVLSHSLWMRRFGGSPAAIGSTLELDGVPWHVVGVMPASFQFPDAQVAFWEQLTSFRAWRGVRDERYSDWGRVIGRLKPRVTIEQAQADMNAVGRRLALAYPPAGPDAAGFAGFGVSLVSLRMQVTGTRLPLALWVLMGAVLAVFLIACANVANLLLARGAARTREMAVRQALGAARGRIVQQLLTESLMLAGAAGTLGFAMAAAGIDFLVSRGPRNLPHRDDFHIDPTALAFTIGISLLASVLCGLIPALRISRAGAALSQRNSIASPSSSRMRGALAVIEVALSVMLVSGAGLLIRSFLHIQAMDSGFRPERVLSMRISSSLSGAAETAFYDATLQRLGAMPGVKAAGFIEDVLQRRNPDFPIAIAGRAEQPREPISGDAVSPGYFEAVGARLLKGRPFSKWDSAGATRVAIVNQTMARHLWPAEDAIGKQFRDADAQPDDPWCTIVGVVSDMRRQGLDREPIAQIFWPYLQHRAGTMDLEVRTAGDPLQLASIMRDQIRSIDKKAVIFQLSTLEDRLDESLAPRRFESWLLGLLSAIALGLAAAGIYGTVRYSVALRTNEIGIRMALGAGAGEVVGMIIRQGLTLTALGLAIGAGGALWLARLFSSLLFGVAPGDPATFGVVAALFGAITMIACAVPAWKAARIDPVCALRDE